MRTLSPYNAPFVPPLSASGVTWTWREFEERMHDGHIHARARFIYDQGREASAARLLEMRTCAQFGVEVAQRWLLDLPPQRLRVDRAQPAMDTSL